MMTDPGVIVLAVYQPNPALLRRQLRSIISQSFQDWHCIVGLDGPDEIALSLTREAIGSDARFEVVQFAQNVGIYFHFERLLSRMPPDTPWIALADQDDYWHESKLEALIGDLDAEGVSGASCQARITTESGCELGRTARRAKALIPLLMVNEVTGCLTIFRSDVLRLALPFPATSPLAIHDHWLGVCAMALQGLHYSDAVLHDYVQHSGNAIGEQKQLSIRDAITKVILGRVSWARITSEPWEWRVTMARALNARITLRESSDLEAIAHGRLTKRLLRLMLRQAMSGQIPAHIATALSFAAAQR